MSNTLDRLGSNSAATDLPFALPLELTVEDRDTIAELWKYPEGEPRDEFALEALKIGVLTLRRASASLDTEFIKRETDRLLGTLRQQLQAHADLAKERIEHSLGRYFDPDSGQFTQRVKQLTSLDGDFNRVVRELIDGDESRLAKTIVAQIGENSPFMKYLSPDQATGLLATLRALVEVQLKEQNDLFKNEFSLDNADSALCRLVGEITNKHGDFAKSLTGKIDEVVKEFSLDEENSALSRLVKKVNSAQETITKEFSLDNEASALQKLKKELLTLLGAHFESSAHFQEEVKVALGKLVTKREVEARGTLHGFTFEEAVCDLIAAECQPRGDIFEPTGKRVGLIKNCCKGDGVIELGCDHAAAGAKIVVEAKEDAKYTLAMARAEIEEARKNRGAQFGLFVFSRKSAPANCDSLCRIGDDIFTVWDAEDIMSDLRLKAALEIARALCVRHRQARQRQTMDFTTIDKSILDIEKHVGNLDLIGKAAETIQSSNNRILDRVRIDRDALNKQIEVLRECMGNLKESLGASELAAD